MVGKEIWELVLFLPLIFRISPFNLHDMMVSRQQSNRPITAWCGDIVEKVIHGPRACQALGLPSTTVRMQEELSGPR